MAMPHAADPFRRGPRRQAGRLLPDRVWQAWVSGQSFSRRVPLPGGSVVVWQGTGKSLNPHLPSGLQAVAFPKGRKYSLVKQTMFGVNAGGYVSVMPFGLKLRLNPKWQGS